MSRPSDWKIALQGVAITTKTRNTQNTLNKGRENALFMLGEAEETAESPVNAAYRYK